MKRLISMLLMFVLVVMFSLVNSYAIGAKGKGAVTKWLGQLPDGKLIMQNRAGALVSIKGSTSSYGVEISTSIKVKGAIECDATTTNFDDSVIRYSTTTVGVITTARITTIQGAPSVSGGATIDNAIVTYSTTTVGVITTGRITTIQGNPTVSGGATIDNATVTNSTTTVAKVATAIISTAQVTSASFTDATISVAGVTTLQVGALSTKAVTSDATNFAVAVSTRVRTVTLNLPSQGTSLPTTGNYILGDLSMCVIDGIATLYIATETIKAASSWAKVGGQ